MQQFFDELFFALLLLALVINGWYLCFKLIIYTLEGKQFPNFTKAISWRPSHPNVWGVAVSIGTVGLIFRYLLSNSNQIEHWLAELLIDLAPEMIGMTLAIAIIDELNQKRIEQQRRQELLEQLYSRVPDAAVEALRLIRRENGWWDELDKTAFSGVQWSGADLRSVNLSQTLFLNANLSKADFKGAVLVQSDFGGANLEGADFWRANLLEAQLGRANLNGSILTGAKLERAKMFDVNLENAILQGANLSNAHLQIAKLKRVNLSDANLAGANLEDANLENAQLWRVNLAEANLGGADLRGADLWSATLEGTQLRHAKYNSYTRWPHDFDPKKVGAIEVE